jgi:hypothetical protein
VDPELQQAAVFPFSEPEPGKKKLHVGSGSGNADELHNATSFRRKLNSLLGAIVHILLHHMYVV